MDFILWSQSGTSRGACVELHQICNCDFWPCRRSQQLCQDL